MIKIVVITDGQWHCRSPLCGYGEGDPQTVAPAPLTKQAYMINLASYQTAWLRPVDEHRWLERFGNRIHPCARADEMGQLNSRARHPAGPVVHTICKNPKACDTGVSVPK